MVGSYLRSAVLPLAERYGLKRLPMGKRGLRDEAGGFECLSVAALQCG